MNNTKQSELKKKQLKNQSKREKSKQNTQDRQWVTFIGIFLNLFRLSVKLNHSN